MKPDFTNNPVVRHSIEFSIMVIKYVETLEANRKFVIAKQLLRSGTSIGHQYWKLKVQKAKRISFIN